MIDKRVKRSSVFNTFSEEEKQRFFNMKALKFIHHVDTLYYTIFLKYDTRQGAPGELDKLIEIFEELKVNIEKTGEAQWWDYDTGHVFTRCSYGCYGFCISLPNYYDVFFARNLPNDNTPRICVQLRSTGLWELGEYILLKNSLDFVKELITLFGCEIVKTQENRIDYCYHTNAIQNPMDFFSDSCLANNCYTHLEIYNKVGRKVGKNLTVEYLSLGQRKSNNIFFRTYNKVREVIEKGYKGFFLEFWLNVGLINYYDYWVYLYAYNKRSYNSIYKGMLEFYVKFSDESNCKDLKNFEIVELFKSALVDNTKTFLDYRKIALNYLPAPTSVINIEFQTMRKFYYYADSLIDSFPISSDLGDWELLRIFRILDNRKIFLDYLTGNVVKFCKSDDETIYLDFWKRLRSCKVNKTINAKFKRDYSKQPDINLLVTKFRNTMATFSLYQGNFDTSMEEDLSCMLLNVLTDNTVEYNDGILDCYDFKYNKIKKKKEKALASFLKKAPKTLSENNK